MRKKYIVLAVLLVAVSVSFYAFATKPKIVRNMEQKVIDAVAPTTYEPMFAPSPARADGTMKIYAQIGNIQGESTDAAHKNWIEADSFSWGIDKSGTSSPKSETMILKMKTSKASPKLFDATARGTIESQVLIAMQKPGETQDFIQWTIRSAIISSFKTSADPNGGSVDEVDIIFPNGNISEDYFEIQPDGKTGAKTNAGWDFKTNKAL